MNAVSYITNGLTWKSSYNVVAPESGDTVDLVGWVGGLRTTPQANLDNATVKLLAGKRKQAAGAPAHGHVQGDRRLRDGCGRCAAGDGKSV